MSCFDLGRAGRRVLGLAVASAGLFWIGGGALAAPAPVPPSLPPAPVPATSPAKSAPGAVAARPTPPNGKWLTDEQGRRYFIDKLSKKEVRFLRLDAHHVRTVWGIDIEVEKEDADYLYYKVFDDEALQTGPVAHPKPSADVLAEIAKAYEVSTPVADRVRFADFGAGLPRSGQWRNGFVLVDLDGDGHLDIFHSPPRKSARTPVGFLGDGHGHWHPWTGVRFPPAPYDYGDVTVGDWLGDGHLGFALGVHLKGLMAFAGDGKGGFKPYSKGLDWESPEHPAVFTSRRLATLDVNGDGRPDIVALGEGPRLNTGRGQEAKLGQSEAFGLVAYLNGKDGTWHRTQISDSPGLFGDDLAVGDFNGDGRKDIAATTGAMGEKDLVYLAQPQGGFQKVTLDAIRPRSYVTAIAAGDFDHDGRDDLAIGYLSSEADGVSRTAIDVFYSRPNGTWERRVLVVQEGREMITALATGDLDGDHQTDLVALTGAGKVWVFLGDGKGFFVRQEPTTGLEPLDKDCRGFRVILADLDGDGRDEMVADFAGEPSPMYAPDICLSGGNLRAWRVAGAAPQPK